MERRIINIVKYLNLNSLFFSRGTSQRAGLSGLVFVSQQEERIWLSRNIRLAKGDARIPGSGYDSSADTVWKF